VIGNFALSAANWGQGVDERLDGKRPSIVPEARPVIHHLLTKKGGSGRDQESPEKCCPERDLDGFTLVGQSVVQGKDMFSGVRSLNQLAPLKVGVGAADAGFSLRGVQ